MEGDRGQYEMIDVDLKQKNQSWQETLPYETDVISNKDSTTSGSHEFSIYDSYFVDIFGLVGSATVIIALAVVLSRYDHQPTPGWNNVSLNTIASWMSTVIRFLLLMAVSRSIGQLKWIWLATKPRQIKDIGDLDSASRGAWGSLQVLLSTKLWHLHSIGCMAMILAIGIGPFTQNAIRNYIYTDVEATLATISRASSYNSLGPRNSHVLYGIDQVMTANVYSAILNTADTQPWAIPEFTCTTGNCSFPVLTTLAVHSTCVNLTDQIKTSCVNLTNGQQNCTFSLNSGTALWIEPGSGGTVFVMNSTSEGLLGNRSAITPVQYITIKDVAYVDDQAYANPKANFSLAAAECMLNICVDTLHPNVSLNTLSEPLLASWCSTGGNAVANPPVYNYNLSDAGVWEVEDYDSGLSGNATPIGIYGTLALPPGFDLGPEPVFSVPSLQSFVLSIFGGHITAALDGVSVVPSGSSFQYASADIVQAIFYGNISGCAAGDDHLECAMNNVAKAMTKTMRDSASQSEYTTGPTWISMPYTRIIWAWLALPIVVWVLAAVLCVVTIWKTRSNRLPVWGNSVFPFMFVPRESAQEKEDRDISNAGLDRTAKETMTRLVLHAAKPHFQ